MHSKLHCIVQYSLYSVHAIIPLQAPARAKYIRKGINVMGENTLELLVYLQLKDRDFSSSSLEELVQCYKDTYGATKKYLDGHEPNGFLF